MADVRILVDFHSWTDVIEPSCFVGLQRRMIIFVQDNFMFIFSMKSWGFFEKLGMCYYTGKCLLVKRTSSVHSLDYEVI